MAREANMQAVERIKAARERSLKIMQMDKSMDKIAENKRGNIETSLNEDVQYSTQPSYQGAQRQSVAPIRSGGPMNGAGAQHVPSVIRESFAADPGFDESSAMMNMLSTPGDLSMLAPASPAPRRQAVTENVQQATQPVQYQQQVDYPMIRTIVEEIVRKYASSLNKKIINESKGGASPLNTIIIGDKFKFLDDSGNIYECTMKKIGNIHNKKKGTI
jgi:hypothetical protein